MSAAARLTRSLANTCTITPRVDGGADSYGHPAVGYGSAVTGVSCRYWVVTDADLALGPVAAGDKYDASLLLPATTTIAVADKVTAVARGAVSVAPGPFEVVAVYPRFGQASVPVFLRADLRKVA